MDESTREESVNMASALEARVDAVHARNEELEARCESLVITNRLTAEENDRLRSALAKSQANYARAIRDRDVLYDALVTAAATCQQGVETVRRQHQEVAAEQKQVGDQSAANLRIVQRGPAVG